MPSIFAGEKAELVLTVSTSLHEGAKNSTKGEVEIKWIDDNKNIESVSLVQRENSVHLFRTMLNRGKYRLPRVTITSYYPLALYRCWTHLDFDKDIWVYPKPIHSQAALKDFPHSEGMSSGIDSSSGGSEFSELRPYQKGDSLRQIAWKSAAKGGDWASKNFIQEDAPSAKWLVFEQESEQNVEKLLGQLCYRVIELSEAQIPFGLQVGTITIPPASGLSHQLKCLEVLACWDLPEKARN